MMNKDNQIILRHCALVAILGMSGAMLVLSGVALKVDTIVDLLLSVRLFEQGNWSGFTMPNGLWTQVMLQPFLYLLPVGWAYLLAMALLSSVMSVLCYTFARKITSHNEWIIIVGSIATGSFFFFPMFYYHDNLAVAFAFAALVCRLLHMRWWWLWSALLLVMSFHAKQPIGIMSAFILAAAIMLSEKGFWRNRSNYLLVGCGTIFFVVSIALHYELAGGYRYMQSTLITPLLFAGQESEPRYARLVRGVFMPFLINPLAMLSDLWQGIGGLGRLVFYPFVMSIYLSYWILFRYYREFLPAQRFGYIALVGMGLCISAVSGGNFSHYILLLPLLISINIALYSHSLWQKLVVSGLAISIIGGVLAYIVHEYQPEKLRLTNRYYPLQVVDGAQGVDPSCQLNLHTFTEAAKKIKSYDKVAYLDDVTQGVFLVADKLPANNHTVMQKNLTIRDIPAFEQNYIAQLHEQKIQALVAWKNKACFMRGEGVEKFPIPLITRYLEQNYNELHVGDDLYIYSVRTQ